MCIRSSFWSPRSCCSRRSPPSALVAQSLTQGGLGLVMVAYPIIALRRFYRDGWILTLVKAFVLGFLYAVIVSPLTSVVLFLTA